MDDIYEDLENYNEVDVIKELKTENKELKAKLAECTSSMEKLQNCILQDFDKMAGEFKKLEMNYSSLLKTARAEIERKTKIITTLNIEKDMLVLNSLNNHHKSLFQIKKAANAKMAVHSDSESTTGQTDIYKEKTLVQRLPENRVSSEDTISSSDAGNIIKKKLENEHKTKDHSKEKQISNKPTPKPLGIANRRKSMPVLNKEFSKFSSDDEYEDSSGILEGKHMSSKFQESNRIDKERGYNSNRKDIPISSFEKYDKYDVYHSTYKSKNSQYDRDKFKRTEEFEPRQKRKWRYSPKRTFRKDNRDAYESQDRRSNYGRGRIVLSPVYKDAYESHEYRTNYGRSRVVHSPDKRDVHESKVRGSDYRRGRQISPAIKDAYEIQDHKSSYAKGRVVSPANKDAYENRFHRSEYKKGKLSSPANKDIYETQYCKSDSSSRVVESAILENYNRKRSRDEKNENEQGPESQKGQTKHEENLNCDTDQNHCDEELTKHMSNSDLDEPQSKKLKTSAKVDRSNDQNLLIDLNQFVSCESPDYTPVENVTSEQPVKEIMNTATTQLEDPRLISKKYITVKNKDIITLSTVLGRNIDLEIVNTSAWQKMNIPRALLHKAPQFDEQVVDDIFSDFQYPMSNETVESGETVDYKQIDCVTSDIQNEISPQRENPIEKFVLPKEIIDHCENQNETMNMINETQKPDDSKSKDTSNNLELKDSASQSDHNLVDAILQVNEKSADTTGKSQDHFPPNIKNYKIPKIQKIANANEKSISLSRKRNKLKVKKSENSNEENRLKSQKHISQKDEKHDVIKTGHFYEKSSVETAVKLQGSKDHDEIYIKNSETKRIILSNSLSEITSSEEDSANSLVTKILTNREIIQNDLALSDDNIPQVSDSAQKVKSDLNVKKRKSKKSHKHKKSSKMSDNPKDCTSEQKISQTTKELVAEDTKTNFNDLFGDSVSLITPEDLQITTSQAQTISQRCSVDCEGNQNAVDLYLNNSTVKSNETKNNNNDHLEITENAISTSDMIATKANLENVYETNNEVKRDDKLDVIKKTGNENDKNCEADEGISQSTSETSDVLLKAEKLLELKVDLSKNEIAKKKTEVKQKSRNVQGENKKYIQLKSSNLTDENVRDDVRDNLQETEKCTTQNPYIDSINSSINNVDEQISAVDSASVSEDNVVKTIIISSGYQKNVISDTINANSEKYSESKDHVTLLKIKENSIKAVATSTPCKEWQNNSTDAVASLETLSSSHVTTHATILPEMQSSQDEVPDIRIFVKRRRKVLKKA